jgi:hypothetical protein
MTSQECFNNLAELKSLIKQISDLDSVFCIEMNVTDNNIDKDGNLRTGVLVEVYIRLEDPDITFSLAENCTDMMLLKLQRYYDDVLIME